MQTLVYENYSKFIDATETICNMQTSISSMDADLHELKSSMQRVNEKSDAINGNLRDRRKKIEHLNGVRRLLIKLRFLYELPTRLQRAIELVSCEKACCGHLQSSVWVYMSWYLALCLV